MKLVAGSGRSGTTWVQDALANANGLRPVFEPLHPYVSDMGNCYAHRALSVSDDAPELLQFLEEVGAGRHHSFWTKYRRRMRWLFPPPAEFSTRADAGRLYRNWVKFFRELPRLAYVARRREPLVKCIRANLMLGWLSRNCGWKIVLLVRHPGAVIESELRGAWNPEFALNRFRDDARLDEITGGRYRKLLERQLSGVEALATRWIVENQWVVEQAQANGVTVVYYERLKDFPNREWPLVAQALELQQVPPPDILKRPSQQSSPTRSSATSESTEPLRWQRVLSNDQVDLIQRTLDLAECDLYKMSDANPRSATLTVEASGRSGHAS